MRRDLNPVDLAMWEGAGGHAGGAAPGRGQQPRSERSDVGAQDAGMWEQAGQLDRPLAVQRQMLVEQWRRDAAAWSGAPRASASPPRPAAADPVSIPDVPRPDGLPAAAESPRGTRVTQRAPTEPEPQDAAGKPETIPAAARDPAPAGDRPGSAGELTAGQRHVLVMVERRRVAVPAVLYSRHAEITALTLGQVLDAAGCPGAAAAVGADPASPLGKLPGPRLAAVIDALPAWATRVRP